MLNILRQLKPTSDSYAGGHAFAVMRLTLRQSCLRGLYPTFRISNDFVRSVAGTDRR